MPNREAPVALTLLAALLFAAAGPALADDEVGDSGPETPNGGGPLPMAGVADFPGPRLTFRTAGGALADLSVDGVAFLESLELSPGPNASDLRLAPGGAATWRDPQGRALGYAVGGANPGLRIEAGANTTITVRKAATATVVDSTLPGLRIATSAGTVLLRAHGSAAPGGNVSALTWTFPSGGALSLLFLLGDSAWTRTAAANDAWWAATVTGEPDTGATSILASPPGLGTLGDSAYGHHLGVQFTLPKDGAFHTVRVTLQEDLLGAVADPRKIVVRALMSEAAEPNARDNFGKVQTAEDLALIAGSFGPFYNVTRTGAGWDFTVLLRGHGLTSLLFERDVTAPSLTSPVRVENVTHQSLMLYTGTNEYSLVRLFLKSGDHEQEHTTSVLSLQQTFPLQGLKPARTYTYVVTTTDVAGNTQKVHEGNFTTLEKPVLPKPRITSVSPPEGARLSESPGTLSASFESPESPVDPSRVRVFVNLKEVPASEVQGLVITDRDMHYTPAAAFPSGTHVVSVEVTNADGETAVKRWTFTVEGQQTPGPGFTLFALALVGAALLTRRR